MTLHNAIILANDNRKTVQVAVGEHKVGILEVGIKPHIIDDLVLNVLLEHTQAKINGSIGGFVGGGG